MKRTNRLATGIKRRILDWLGVNAPVGLANLTTREAWLEQTLARLPAGSRILDAGAGERQYARFCSHLQYVSQDFAAYNSSGDGVGLQMNRWDYSGLDIVSDITSIPQPDGSFDAIMCIEVLEHLPYPVEALRELSRLLRPGGDLILSAPFCSLTHFAPYFYQTGYSRYFYEYWLENLGFEIQEIAWNGNYFEWLAQEVRRLPEISQRYAGQKMDPLGRAASAVILKRLADYSRRDRGSNELLAYGLHIRAHKKG